MVHGLLVCRDATAGGEGRLNLKGVLEVVAVDRLPGNAGPLTFVAFVRNLPPGKGACTFVIRPADRPEAVAARYPMQFELPETFQGRQVALQVQVPSIPVKRGGWYDVILEWSGRAIAVNRFAIGVRHAE